MAFHKISSLLIALAIVFTFKTAWSAEIHGRSSTQYLWFTNIFNDKQQGEFAEFLTLSVTKIDKDDKLSFQGYANLTQDVRNGQGLNGRLYYLYGDYKGMFDKVDIRLGRQFVNSAAGSAIIDGGLINVKNVGPIAFSIMGGRNVFFGIDGELTHADDVVAGVSAMLSGFSTTDAELAYFIKMDRDGIAREQIGASFKQYLFSGLKLYGNTRFDMASETFNEVLAGVKYFPTANMVLTAEWFQSYPTFDYTSIFSVFAVNRYQEGSFRADYTVNDKVAVHGTYKRQDFGENTAGDVFEAGVKIRPINSLIVDLAYDRRQGYSGDLNGGTVDVTYEATNKLNLAGGLTYDVYQRDGMTGETTAQTYWLGTRYKLDKSISLDCRVQDSVNIRYKQDWQGRVAFNYDF